MPYDLSKRFVIAVSSRALFDLSKENEIYVQQGIKEYARHQRENEDVILEPGTAFPLVKALLNLNEHLPEDRAIEVIVVSKNDFDTSLRIWNSVASHNLGISRGTFTGGEPAPKYLQAYSVGLFLSADHDDVREAFELGIPAGFVFGVRKGYRHNDVEQIRIAFDGDAVLFADESERIYQERGMDEFQDHERRKARVPMHDGPFAKLLVAMSYLQKHLPPDQEHRIRTALITARNSPAHERVIRTLRAKNMRVDEAHFLGGISKNEVLEAFDPHIFFDDQIGHCGRASRVVPTAKVMSTLDADNPTLVPPCPICGRPTERRTATRGATKGKPFWGCGNFPSCRGTISIS